MTQPVLTPLVCDAAMPRVWPRATDWLPVNLYYGAQAGNGGVAALSQIQLVCLARHARRIAHPPGNFNARQAMPGAINVAFFDGHVAPVPLEQLWSLSWHQDYVPPAKQPGLR